MTPTPDTVPQIFRILPEVILTITGVLVMLVDAAMAPASNRRPLGWLASLGTVIALWASLWQLSSAKIPRPRSSFTPPLACMPGWPPTLPDRALKPELSIGSDRIDRGNPC